MRVGLVIASAALMPGGFVILALLWWRRRQLDRERRAIALQIVPPKQTFEKTSIDETEAIRAAAQRRRVHAEEIRRDAHRIEAGEPVVERSRPRLVK